MLMEGVQCCGFVGRVDVVTECEYLTNRYVAFIAPCGRSRWKVSSAAVVGRVDVVGQSVAIAAPLAVLLILSLLYQMAGSGARLL